MSPRPCPVQWVDKHAVRPDRDFPEGGHLLTSGCGVTLLLAYRYLRLLRGGVQWREEPLRISLRRVD